MTYHFWWRGVWYTVATDHGQATLNWTLKFRYPDERRPKKFPWTAEKIAEAWAIGARDARVRAMTDSNRLENRV